MVITSNRDEHISRNANLVPVEEIIGHKRVVYPKDSVAGGTWFSMNENGHVLVLLNGAFKNHRRTPPYSKSRGLIVLQLISEDHPVKALQVLDLDNIEPFTLIILEATHLYEFRWDGAEKLLKNLDSAKPHIWSSATLYDEKAAHMRQGHFNDFVSQENFEQKTILAFHQENHGDFENGFIIDRKNGLKTLSVTQVLKQNGSLTMDHHDLESGSKATIDLMITSAVTA